MALQTASALTRCQRVQERYWHRRLAARAQHRVAIPVLAVAATARQPKERKLQSLCAFGEMVVGARANVAAALKMVAAVVEVSALPSSNVAAVAATKPEGASDSC